MFYDCKNLKSFVVPNSASFICEYAFEGCTGLTSITISESVTSIREGAFSGCTGLTSVNIIDLAAWCKINFELDGYYKHSSNPLEKAHHLYLNGKEITDLVIPSSVTSIKCGAFYGCTGLTSITIPNSVTSIGKNAFDYCSGLTSVHISDLAAWCNISFGSSPLEKAHHLYLNGEEITDLVIPSSVTSIKWGAFSGCTGLTSVTIPNSVTYIGEYAFNGCKGLTSVTIPNSITSIGNYAFEGCTSLTSVNITDLVTWCKINFDNYSNNPLVYAHRLYLNGEEITDLVIPSSVTSIGNYAFSGCTSLTSVIIHNSVTSIGYSAFSGCTGLTSVTIGNSVTSIGRSAFYGCTGLAEVTCKAKTPPAIYYGYYDYSFKNISPDAKLYVPIGSRNAYKSSYWGGFFKQENIIEKEM